MNTKESSGVADPFAPPGEDQPTERRSQKPETPVWGWFFFVACLGIMIATRGGAIWGGVGGGVGGVCLKISQNREMPVVNRVLLCSLITAVLWIGIVVLLQSLRG